MAEYGSNSVAVRFFREVVPEEQTRNKSTAMPPGSPAIGGVMVGGNPPKPAKGQMRNLPWRSWLGPKRPHSKRAKRKSSLGTLMGR
jgi:hypothetical protein